MVLVHHYGLGDILTADTALYHHTFEPVSSSGDPQTDGRRRSRINAMLTVGQGQNGQYLPVPGVR